jgi:hypothetical protein
VSGVAAPALELLIEAVPARGCPVHVPDLPGHSFRAVDVDVARAAAPAYVVAYGRWLAGHGAADLTPLAARLVDAWTTLRPVVVQQRLGAPVWDSGQPAALFDRDRRELDDEAVGAHLRVARLALEPRRADRRGGGRLRRGPPQAAGPASSAAPTRPDRYADSMRPAPSPPKPSPARTRPRPSANAGAGWGRSGWA